MFNLQPGQGLGHRASGDLAFGLGLALVVAVVVSGGGGVWWELPKPKIRKELPLALFKDDEDVIQLVVWMVTSGILE